LFILLFLFLFLLGKHERQLPSCANLPCPL
jgi:hypothetical protein